jgi:effector-binding domain-containing protein
MVNCEIIHAVFGDSLLRGLVRRLLYGIVALIVILIVIGLLLPSTSRVQVSSKIDASAATVYAQLNDFRRLALWAPLLDIDPNVRVLYSGNRRGPGSTMTWNGAIAGSGTQTIVNSVPFEQVDIVLNRGEPGEAFSRFSLAEESGATTVTWSFETDYGLNIVGRYFAPLFGRVVARDCQAGLDKLRQLAESLPRTDFSDLQIEQIVVEAVEIAYQQATSAADAGAMADAMGKAYFDIVTFIDKQGLQDAGAPLSILRTFSGSELVFDAAIPVRGTSEATPRDTPGVKLGFTYEGPVIRVKHTGSYRALAETHRKIAAYLAAHGLQRNGPAWESYVSDPRSVAEDELITLIFYPISPD